MQNTETGKGAATGARGRRKTYVVNPAFQWKYTVLFMVAAFIVSALMSVTLFGVHFHQARARTLALQNNPDAAPNGEMLLLLLFSALAFSIVAAATVGLWSIFFTHRVSGPIFVIGRWLDEVADGRVPKIRALRKKDEFKQFHASFEQALETVRQRGRAQCAGLTESLAIANAARDADDQARRCALEKIAKQLDALRQDVAQFIGEPIPEPTDPPVDVRSAGATADPALAELRV